MAPYSGSAAYSYEYFMLWMRNKTDEAFRSFSVILKETQNTLIFYI